MTCTQLVSANSSSVVAIEAAAVAEQVRCRSASCCGTSHGAAVVPERRVAALGRMVVQDQEIADALEFECRSAGCNRSIITGLKSAVREETEQTCVTADWIRWMLVDSSGSMKPLERPIATQFLFQNFLRLPVVKRSGRGSRKRAPSRFASSVAAGFVVADVRARIDVAVAGAMLQRNAPLPACLPRGGARVGSGRADRCRTARPAHGRRAASGSSPHSRCAGPARSAGRGSPEQSMNRSPGIFSPLSSTIASMNPSAGRNRVSFTLPSVRRTPRASAKRRRYHAYMPASKW